ncbi:hypothetical protein [Streptomyces sp. PT12]|uniref:hypothetical protein n=1 Tax=Streptomyces sp. PT12 TaxID=1510197 RepID=UPI000DE57125|nr:hypothetical protein [Streptomyces sp. PT12]RBM12687.1 hypothetical protein DEH69_19790 [Streptomyces sp. PT12]
MLRPNWFHQNLTEGVLADLAAARGGVLAVPVGEAACSLIDARDIAAVAVAALLGEHHGREYDRTGPEPLTFERVAAISAAAGLPVRAYRPVPDAEFRAAAAGLGWHPAYVAQLSELFALIESGATAGVSPHVARVLGRDPVSLRAFSSRLTGRSGRSSWGLGRVRSII